MTIFGREPLVIVNAVRLVVLAAVSFGLDLSEAQIVSVMLALEAVLTLFSRSQVTPNETVEEHLDTAVRLAHMGLPPADDIATTGAPGDG